MKGCSEMESNMYFLICFFSLWICIFIFAITKRITIALVYNILWSFLCIVTCIMDLPRSESAYLFVFANMTLFSVCYIGVYICLQNKQGVIKYACKEEPEMEARFFIVNKYSLIITVIALLYLAHYLGFTLSSFSSVSNLMLKMNSISSRRYSTDEVNMPIINRLVCTVMYAICGYAGFFMSKKLDKRCLYMLGLVMIQTVLLNTKATMVFGVAFWLGGYMTGMLFFKKKISFKWVMLMLFSFTFLFLFVITVNYFRHAGALSYVDEIKKIMLSYFIGPFSAFSIWFENRESMELGFGSNTFSCVFRWLGINVQEHGDFVSLGEDVTTNVYTIYKHLICDFSCIGTILISGGLGTLSAFVDRKLLMNKKKYIGISIVIIATIVCAFFSSMFRYTTNVLASLWVLLVVSSTRRNRL